MAVRTVQVLPLTSIRFFLALWVVIYHLAAPESWFALWLRRFPDPVFSLFNTGYIAVGVFFILSGFVLSCNYSLAVSWSSSQLRRFAIARFARIYPAYCLGLLLLVPFVGVTVAKNLSTVKLAKQVILAVLNFTLLQSWIPKAALSWNSPGWSLSNEAFFYCCFPFIGVALWKASRLRSLAIAGALLWAAALIAPVLAISIPLSGFGDVSATSLHAFGDMSNTSLQTHGDPLWSANLINFNPLLRIPEFCIGIVIGRLYHELQSKSAWLLGRGHYLYVPGIVLELLVIADSKPVPSVLLHNGLLTPLHCLVILGFALGGGSLYPVLSSRSLVFLGQSSYAVYILQQPVWMWMTYIARRMSSAKLSGFGEMVLYLLVLVSLSALVFKFVEEPTNRLLKTHLTSWFDRSRQKNTDMCLPA